MDSRVWEKAEKQDDRISFLPEIVNMEDPYLSTAAAFVT